MHLVDWKSGAGQVIGSMKCASGGGGGGGGIHGLWWVPAAGADGVLGGESGSGHDEKHLAVLTGEAEVYIWDVGQRRCVRRWKDEGGYRSAGRVLAGGGGASGYMAIGLVARFYLDEFFCSGFVVRLGQAVGLSTSTAQTRSPFHEMRKRPRFLRQVWSSPSWQRHWGTSRRRYRRCDSTTMRKSWRWPAKKRKMPCAWYEYVFFYLGCFLMLFSSRFIYHR